MRFEPAAFHTLRVTLPPTSLKLQALKHRNRLPRGTLVMAEVPSRPICPSKVDVGDGKVRAIRLRQQE